MGMGRIVDSGSVSQVAGGKIKTKVNWPCPVIAYEKQGAAVSRPLRRPLRCLQWPLHYFLIREMPGPPDFPAAPAMFCRRRKSSAVDSVRLLEASMYLVLSSSGNVL